MYRIELGPDDIGVFRTVEEIATGIKSGVITTRSRIYHQATDRWLPIEFHPHYRQAAELAATMTTSRTPSGPRPAVALAAAPTPKPVAVAPKPLAVAAKGVAVALHRVVARVPEPLPPPAPAPTPAPAPAPAPVAALVAEPTPAEEEPLPTHGGAEPAEAEPAEAELAEAELAEPVSEGPMLEALELLTPEAEFISLDEPLAVHATAAVPPDGARPFMRAPLRFQLAPGKPRRPFRLALAGAALAVTTQLGLSAAPPPWTLDLGLDRPLALLRIDKIRAMLRWPASDSVVTPVVQPVPAPAAAPTPIAITRTPVVERTPEPQGSPSFGSSSAFGSAASGSTLPLKSAPVPRPNPAPPVTKPAPAVDPIVIAPAPSGIVFTPNALPATSGAREGKLTPALLVSRYQAAYTDARTELETGFRTAGFADLFAPQRLLSPQGVRSARLAAATGSAYVAKYRRREADIETAYADSFAVLSKQFNWSADERRGWEGRQVLRESPDIAKLASFLLQSIDSAYGLLSSQEGAYEIANGTITFQDAKAARAYAELRPWLDRRTHQWADTAAGRPSSAARILRAIGSNRLPEGGAF